VALTAGLERSLALLRTLAAALDRIPGRSRATHEARVQYAQLRRLAERRRRRHVKPRRAIGELDASTEIKLGREAQPRQAIRRAVRRSDGDTVRTSAGRDLGPGRIDRASVTPERHFQDLQSRIPSRRPRLALRSAVRRARAGNRALGRLPSFRDSVARLYNSQVQSTTVPMPASVILSVQIDVAITTQVGGVGPAVP